ncbi:MAG: 50S ribosomal protein L10 [Cytophagales bacterium]|jgi:large subunit ribosomal protein L10
MTKEEKAVIIEELKNKFNSHDFFYVTDASGMTVEQVNAFRKLCFSKGIEYRVVKNSLIKKALEAVEGDYAEFNSVLKGFSGLLFTNESGKAPALMLKEFYQGGSSKPELKGASIDKCLYVGKDSLESLASIKSREELIGEIIGLLQSPAKNVISALKSGEHTIAGVVKTLQDRGE